MCVFVYDKKLQVYYLLTPKYIFVFFNSCLTHHLADATRQLIRLLLFRSEDFFICFYVRWSTISGKTQATDGALTVGKEVAIACGHAKLINNFL